MCTCDMSMQKHVSFACTLRDKTSCVWALVSEPGFGDFQISNFRDSLVLQNMFEKSGGEISSKIIKVSWIDLDKTEGLGVPFLVH